MKQVFSILFIIYSLNAFSQSISLKGKIGKYNINMSLHAERDSIVGSYYYSNPSNKLTLAAKMFHEEILYIEERYNGKTTGEFYLTKEGDSLKGKWVSEKAWHPVELKITEGKWNDITITKAENAISNSINGTYYESYYFINDYHFSEDNMQIEIGFNGGSLSIQSISEDSIKFSLNKVCGPTYHFATANGYAVKINDSTYSYVNNDGYSDNPCSLDFIYEDYQFKIVQNSSSFDCGFGARAYAEGTFQKETDKIIETEY